MPQDFRLVSRLKGLSTMRLHSFLKHKYNLITEFAETDENARAWLSWNSYVLSVSCSWPSLCTMASRHLIRSVRLPNIHVFKTTNSVSSHSRFPAAVSTNILGTNNFGLRRPLSHLLRSPAQSIRPLLLTKPHTRCFHSTPSRHGFPVIPVLASIFKVERICPLNTPKNLLSFRHQQV